VNGQDSKAEVFDVFLCHNSEDKPAVREIARKLVGEGIKPWLDVEQIPPGSSWQTELGEQIKSIKSAAVFVGNSGIGPWQNEEIQAFFGLHRAEMSRYSDYPGFCYHNTRVAVDAEKPAPRGFPCIRPRPAQATHLGYYVPEASSKRKVDSR
jgi:hypothetical protein